MKLIREIDMNRIKRQRIHQALVNALADLAGPDDFRYGDKNEYICHAIENTNPNPATTGGGLDAQKIISDRLWPNSSLDGWLEQTMGIKSEDLTWENMQTHRHAWLKMLIKEFSK
jgi:hypothetical protein